MVRDQALALSGLLSQKVGGPSVFPAPARRPVASGLQRRAHLVDEPGRRPVPPRTLHVLAANGSLSVDGRVRRPQPRDLRDPPGAHQYAAPVARDLE